MNEEQRKKYKTDATKYLVDLHKQMKTLERIIMAIDFEQPDVIHNEGVKFIIENERNFLHLKKLGYDIMDNSNEMNRMADVDWIGRTDDFPASLTKVKDDVWKFHLPPFYSINSKERGKSSVGKFMFFLVLMLIEEYVKNEKITGLKDPVIYFEHHICTDREHVFDFDNIESKRVVDALQGFFITDDNALSITTIHRGVRDQEESYCDLYVGERKGNCFCQRGE